MVVDAAIDAVVACVAVGIHIAQDVKRHITWDHVGVIKDILDQLIRKGNCVPFVAAVDACHDHLFAFAIAKRVHFNGSA